MKILYVDPWCANGSNLYYYTTGLVSAISKYAEVTLVSQYNCVMPDNTNYTVKKKFFPWSYKMKNGKIRLFLRGLEYIDAYRFINKMASIEKYDVIHIEWPLLYDIDTMILKTLKEKCKILSLKAHNILPHSTGKKFIEKFRNIYSVPDLILVHGENLKKEFVSYYPEFRSKVRIQRHGLYMNHDCTCDEDLIDDATKIKINSYNRIYLICGRIDYDKGIDRVVKIWTQKFKESRSLLVIAGKVSSGYNFSEVEKLIGTVSNILYSPGFVDDNLLNYFFIKCNLVILPYRAGSMSGVAFTAANFCKPLLTTEFGVINEYIIEGKNSFLVPNNEVALENAMVEVESIPNEKLSAMGKNLKEYFNQRYSWEKVGEDLVNDIFEKEINKSNL